MGEILIAGMGSLFMCMFLGPKFIEFLRAREFGQHIREDGPKATTRRRARRRWADCSSSSRSASRS